MPRCSTGPMARATRSFPAHSSVPWRHGENRCRSIGSIARISGQAQKEFFVNEGLAIMDALLHPVVEGVQTTPPNTPADGEMWIVATPGQAEWTGQDDNLAFFHGSEWRFIVPYDGFRAYNRSLGRIDLFIGQWSSLNEPQPPSGGVVVDTEARASIAEILAALSAAGVFSQN
ncbi:DUF2793 domain-containing protein [Altererythrobacter sp.]|uniref:DUF2793 domain-containing protein n=1 Tax=Altererythrobacter sp. TaxID=1872480 RepID=UPI003D02C3D4